MKNQLTAGLVFLLCFAKGTMSDENDSVLPHLEDVTVTGLRAILELTQQIDDSQQDVSGNSTLRSTLQRNIQAAQSLRNKTKCLVAWAANKIANATAETDLLEQQVTNHRVTLDSLNQQRAQLDSRHKSLEKSMLLDLRFIDDARELLTNATLDKLKDRILPAETQVDKLNKTIQEVQVQLDSVNNEIQTLEQTLKDTESLLQEKWNLLKAQPTELDPLVDADNALKDYVDILVDYEKNVDVLDADSRIKLFVEPMIRSLGFLRIEGPSLIIAMWINSAFDSASNSCDDCDIPSC